MSDRFGSSSSAALMACSACGSSPSRRQTFASPSQLSGSVREIFRISRYSFSASGSFPDQASTRARHARTSISCGASAISCSTTRIAESQSLASAYLRTCACQFGVGVWPSADETVRKKAATRLRNAGQRSRKSLPTPFGSGRTVSVFEHTTIPILVQYGLHSCKQVGGCFQFKTIIISMLREWQSGNCDAGKCDEFGPGKPPHFGTPVVPENRRELLLFS